MSTAPLILITNDDGILAPGIAAAHEALAPLGEVHVVAPQSEQSATSQALTLGRPLRVRELPLGLAVDGTPTDCVFLACDKLLPRRPDLVVSGINAGGNLGVDVIYSGTVGAAMAAALRQIPAIAISQVGNHKLDYELATRFLRPLAADVLRRGLPDRCVLNVNVPKKPARPEGYRITRLGEHGYRDVVEEIKDPRGRTLYWIGGTWDGYQELDGTDCVAVANGQISLTPLRLDRRADDLVQALEATEVQGFAAR